jgi:hypothetical protein
MSTDSMTQVVAYQRKIGALPKQSGFSTRTHWGGSLSRLDKSVRQYILRYKGVTTYAKLVGLAGGTGPGVVADVLSGSNPAQSASMNAIMTAVRDGYNQANSTSWHDVGVDYFTVSSPASSGDPEKLALTLLGEAFQGGPFTASGQFEIDIMTGANVTPDPRPVFNWSLALSANDSARTLTLTLDITYVRMNTDNFLEIAIGFVLGNLIAPFGSPSAIATSIAVGAALTGAYESFANSTLLNALAGPLNVTPWVIPPIEVTIKHPQTSEFVFSLTYQFDPTTWSSLKQIAARAQEAAAWAKLLGI